ncbi:hypothetical protein HU200_048837 [Digitaria exilis]|uniref:Jacalin-type lectin domain-containing protein n=1 Tax=Digitaria exilis TaxID=1010633 RepID=A0A835AUU5_9POAL|nr:hypothetical protein HU200_048837 [Digitaria exilis]
MIGPWEGNAGKAHTIKGASHRLESITVWSADVVDAFAFSYSEPNGKKHNVGPWGGPAGSDNVSCLQIHLGPSEFLLEVSGTTGPYICASADVVKSIKLVTNAGSYGPFGSGGGTSRLQCKTRAALLASLAVRRLLSMQSVSTRVTAVPSLLSAVVSKRRLKVIRRWNQFLTWKQLRKETEKRMIMS